MRARELIEAHFEAWNARDRAGMVRDLAEDIAIEEDPGFQISAGTYRGHDGAFALWEQLFDIADDARVDVQEIEELGDGRALVLMTMHATFRESGISGSREMGHVWHIEGGRATRVRVFGSHADARAAI
jgi:ketosteroid isomerase-like protein